MKRTEFQKCAGCGEGIGHAGNIDFYVVEVQQYVVMKQAVHERVGLEMMMGGGTRGAVLAEVLGTNEDLARPLYTRPHRLFFCHACALGNKFSAMEMMDIEEQPV